PGGWALVSLGGRLISLGVMLGSRAAVSVTSEGPLVSRCRGVSLSASRGDTDFVLAGPPAEGESLFGRAGGRVSVRAGRVSATTGFSVTVGNCRFSHYGETTKSQPANHPGSGRGGNGATRSEGIEPGRRS